MGSKSRRKELRRKLKKLRRKLKKLSPKIWTFKRKRRAVCGTSRSSVVFLNGAREAMLSQPLEELLVLDASSVLIKRTCQRTTSPVFPKELSSASPPLELPQPLLSRAKYAAEDQLTPILNPKKR